MIKKFFLYLINDIFHGDDISETNGWFIMELVDQTSFIPDAKKLVKDTHASKMEIFNTSRKQKMEKKEQMLMDDDEKREGARSENHLMKQIKIKNEFLNETEKKLGKGQKKVTKRVLNRGWESIKRQNLTE